MERYVWELSKGFYIIDKLKYTNELYTYLLKRFIYEFTDYYDSSNNTFYMNRQEPNGFETY